MTPPAGVPRARKRFGQHFLEPAWVARLLDVLRPDDSDTFLEIGPGRGAVTVPLAARVARLIAVEIDRDLATNLASRVAPHVRIVEGDFLAVDLSKLLAGTDLPVRVVANLPYNVASPILFALLHAAGEGRLLRDAMLMVQREVADRLVAQPGDRAYGAMAIQVARLANAERVLTLPPGAFRPPPKVTSAVVRLVFRPSPVDAGSPVLFEQVVRGAFLQRRKTIANAIQPLARARGRSAADVLASAGLDGSRRPEALTLGDFAALARAML
jgi:16S rRNA (adenine1518-N6/adenine1519-N6)-dimethyltransferase